MSADALQAAGQFGDQFGAINALFTALTVLLVFIAFREERGDRKESENRWRKEREESDADRKRAEVDRMITHFVNAMERYLRARSAVSDLQIRVDDGRTSSTEFQGEKAIRRAKDGLRNALNCGEKEYLLHDGEVARNEFQTRVRDWNSAAGPRLVGNLFAHVATMNWALQAVSCLDDRAAVMLRELARGVVTKDEFAVMTTLAIVDDGLKCFVSSVYNLDDCEAPFATYQLKWIGSNRPRKADD